MNVKAWFATMVVSIWWNLGYRIPNTALTFDFWNNIDLNWIFLQS